MDLDTYEVTQLIDDGEYEKDPLGAIGTLEVVSPTLGYLAVYAGANDTRIHSFNPTTGEVYGQVDALAGVYCTVTTRGGIMTDKNKLLWINDQSQAQVIIFNPATGAVDERVGTNLNPGVISFCGEPGGLSAWVSALYQQLLASAIDQDQLSQYVTALETGGHTATTLAQALVNSEAFTSRGLSDAQYVEALVQGLYGRAATDEEKTTPWEFPHPGRRPPGPGGHRHQNLRVLAQVQDSGHAGVLNHRPQPELLRLGSPKLLRR